ncbi:MAG: mechanosensitive ion channel family protein [Alistipes sp.]|nr:mechanosensitive ion channel family protein [Alistipes sp.]
MQALLKRWTDDLLGWMGLTSAADHGWDLWLAVGLVVLFVVLVDYLLRLAVVRGVRRIVERTAVKWDDELFSVRVLNASCHIVSAIVLSAILPVVFEEHTAGRTVVSRLLDSYLVVVVCLFINAMLYASFRIAAQRPAWQDKPIKGLRQTGQGIVLFIGAILIVSLLLGKSPKILLTGLGASAAIVLLIFRDSILGFVSGIQLSANDMLKVGDWIEIEKYGADGTVIEVTLTTVKIRNFDNTIVTVPPYALVSESFQNWQAMKRSGGRRVMRSVSVDMRCVRFCTPEMLARYRKVALVRDYIDDTEQHIAAFDNEHGVARDDEANGLQQTNLEIFRVYLMHYLQQRVPVRKDMRLMVRQLQPTETGLPLQLYFYTDTVDWVEYETIQADVFAHVLAVAGLFDLRIFQSPSGYELAQLGVRSATPAASAPPE